jgi:hypothetical protein
MTLRYARLGVIVVAAGVGLSSSGCALMRVGPVAEIHDVQSTDQAAKNLEAVRALQAASSGHDPMAEHARSAPAPGADSSARRTAPLSPFVPSQPQPTRSSSAARSRREGDGLARLPWTPSTLSPPAPPDRPVSAYTKPAPVGPDYAGPIWCAPDWMGGQRCLAR